jgi:hypothetical protein
MAPEPEKPDSAQARRAAYDRARDDADTAYEAVGDAEDDLADAERTLNEHHAADGDQQLAARQAQVSDAEDAWHDRRHEAHAASQERDRARGQLDDGEA